MSTNQYIVSKNLTIPAFQLKLKGIPVLKRTQLSFYQTYAIRMMQHGFIAATLTELAEKLSDVLNVSCSFVLEFLELLDEFNLISFDESTGKFQLDDSLRQTNTDGYELEVQQADCDSILLMVQGNSREFFLQEDLDSEGYTLKEVSSIVADESTIQASVWENQSRVETLIEKAFSNSNVHLKPEFSFDLGFPIISTYEVSFIARITYRYEESSGVSHCINLEVPNNLLPISICQELEKEYFYDHQIPRFIRLKDSLYQRVDDDVNAVFSAEDEQTQAASSVNPLREQVKDAEDALNQHKERVKELQERDAKELESIIAALNEKEDRIKTNNELLNGLSSDDTLRGFIEASNHELEIERNSLIAQKKDAADASKRRADSEQAEEDALAAVYNSKNALFLDELRKAEEIRKTSKSKIEKLSGLIDSEKSELDEVIQEVIDKFPPKRGKFHLYISTFCVEIDRAVSASDAEAIDSVALYIKKARDVYKDILKATFDVVTGKTADKLATYFEAFNCLELKKCLESKGVSPSFIDRIISYHDVSNAYTHALEKGPLQSKNEKAINEFESLTTKGRRSILLSIPRFYAAITLTKKEIDSINKKLQG